MIKWLADNWLVCAVIIYLVGMMLYGHYRGFLKIAVSMIALILTIALVNVTLPYVSTFLKQNTSVEQVIKEAMLKNVGIDQMDETLIMSPAGQEVAISELHLPKEIKAMLNEDNTGEIWQMLGVEHFIDYVSGYLSNLIFNVIGFVILFIVIWIVLHLIIRFADLFTKLPVIHGLNQIAGAVLGLVQALIFIWLACMVISAMAGTRVGSYLITNISAHAVLSFLFDHNLLSFLLRSLIYYMF